MARRLSCTLTFGLAVSCVVACGAPAAIPTSCDRYAAPGGSDRNRGTLDAPYETVQHLVDSLRPGETGCLRGGLYAQTPIEGYAARFAHGGRDGEPITLRSVPGESAHVRGIVDVTPAADNVNIAGLAIEGTGVQNAIKVYSANVTIEGNDITNRSRPLSCLMLGNPSEGSAENVVVRANYIHDCGSPSHGNKDHAIYSSSVRGGLIEKNLIVNPAAWAIQLYPDSRDVRFANNVIDGGDAVRGGVIFGGDGGSASRDNVVEHNIIANPATHAIASYWERPVGTGNVARDNCLVGSGSAPEAGLKGVKLSDNDVTDARFLDRARRDFRLAPGSPCRDVIGIDVAAELIARGLTPPATGPLAARAPRPAAARARPRARCSRRGPHRRRICRRA